MSIMDRLYGYTREEMSEMTRQKDNIDEGTEDHTKNPFHKVLTQHGFVHKETGERGNKFAPRHDYIEHTYTHPEHGKSHVKIWQYKDGTKPVWFLRHEQSNGIMAPTHGETKPQLHKTLSREYGEPK